MLSMLPELDQLKILAQAYLKYLIQRDESIIKAHLSLNFLTRQRATEQLRLIAGLPGLLNGIDFEIHLFSDYTTQNTSNLMEITPFQFEVSYTPITNLVDIEKITITLHKVIFENNQWKISSIISDDEEILLKNVIENLNAKVADIPLS